MKTEAEILRSIQEYIGSVNKNLLGLQLYDSNNNLVQLSLEIKSNKFIEAGGNWVEFNAYRRSQLVGSISGIMILEGAEKIFISQFLDNYTSEHSETLLKKTPHIPHLVFHMIDTILSSRTITHWVQSTNQSEGAKKVYRKLYADGKYTTAMIPESIRRGFRLKS